MFNLWNIIRAYDNAKFKNKISYLGNIQTPPMRYSKGNTIG